MGNVILKTAKNKKAGGIARYENPEDMLALIKYVVSEKDSDKKVECWGCRGLIEDIESAFAFIDKMQKYLGKDKGRRMYHFIISFPEECRSVAWVYGIANQIADFIGKEYQLVYGVHTDTENLHIHIAMNSVSYVDGRKWHKKRNEFQNWKKEIYLLCSMSYFNILFNT